MRIKKRMEDNNNTIVYITTFGKKFHFNKNCQYIKGKDYKEIPINEAMQKLEGACLRCKNKNNNALNINNEPLRLNNRIINMDQNNRNNNYFYSKNEFNHLPFSKNKNIYQNYGNDNNLNHFNLQKEDKKSEVSKYSESQKFNNFSDLLSSSNSKIIKAKNNTKLFEDKNSDIDFNNINFITEQDKNRQFKLNRQINYNPNNSNLIRKSKKENSLIFPSYKSKKIKIEEYDSNNIINDKNNQNEVINFNKNNKKYNDLSQENNIINNNKIEINKRNNSIINYNQENKEENINIIREQKSNSFYIYNNYKNFSKNYINYISSSSSSNKILKNKNFSNEKNNLIKILKETIQNSITLPIINDKNLSEKISYKNDKIRNGNFKFSFEINPKKKNKININIELGFKIIYSSENDSYNISGEESSESSKDSIIVNDIYQKHYILNQLNIRKKTNIINVLINISEGKFFIIRTQQNIDDIKNSNLFLSKKNILSISNFQKIPLEKIKEICPIFKFNCMDLNIVDIYFNNYD